MSRANKIQAIIKEKLETIDRWQQEVTKQDVIIAEKDQALFDAGEVLEEKEAEIRELKRQLAYTSRPKGSLTIKVEADEEDNLTEPAELTATDIEKDINHGALELGDEEFLGAEEELVEGSVKIEGNRDNGIDELGVYQFSYRKTIPCIGKVWVVRK